MGIVWRFHCEPSTLDWLSEWPHHTAMLPPSPLRRNRPAKVHVGHSKLPRSGFVQAGFTAGGQFPSGSSVMHEPRSDWYTDLKPSEVAICRNETRSLRDPRAHRRGRYG